MKMKTGFKTPICTKCGKVLKGSVPAHEVITCYFCDNPPFDDEDRATNAKDKH
jgi:hypothetical protein